MKLSCLFGHSWDNCQCLRCGRCREYWEGSHQYEGTCKCVRCGTVDPQAAHAWEPAASGKACQVVCSRCGREGEDHLWETSTWIETVAIDDVWMGGHSTSGQESIEHCADDCVRCGKRQWQPDRFLGLG
jgi:hypothetical protein